MDSSPNYELLPDKGVSYVVDKNGEPLIVYGEFGEHYFYSVPFSDKHKPHFLNIRRPIVIDVAGGNSLMLPKQYPEESDGAIYLNCSPQKNITAYWIKDAQKQSMNFG